MYEYNTGNQSHYKNRGVLLGERERERSTIRHDMF